MTSTSDQWGDNRLTNEMVMKASSNPTPPIWKRERYRKIKKMNAKEHNDTYMAINVAPRSTSATLETLGPRVSILLDGKLID